MWNVLNTSWLAKPSRSRARGRSSETNEPVAAKFLRAHDLGRLVVAVVVAGVASTQAVKGRVEVGQLAVGVTGLAQLVATRVAQRIDPAADAGIGVAAQPPRRLHDVGVGVVDDQPRRVVRHHRSVPPPAQPNLGALSAIARSERHLRRIPTRSAPTFHPATPP